MAFKWEEFKKKASFVARALTWLAKAWLALRGKLPALALCAILALAVALVGCSTTMSKISTSTTTMDASGKPVTVTVTKEVEAEVAYYLAKIDEGATRKPIMEMEAGPSGVIEIKAQKVVVWGYPQHTGVKHYVHPWAGVITNGMGIFGNVALAGVGLWGVNEIAKTVSQNQGTHTTYNGSFNASGQGSGVSGQGAVSPGVTVGSNNPVTATDRHDISGSYNPATTAAP